MSLQLLNYFVIRTRHDLVNSSVRLWVWVVKNSDRVCGFWVLELSERKRQRTILDAWQVLT